MGRRRIAEIRGDELDGAGEIAEALAVGLRTKEGDDVRSTPNQFAYQRATGESASPGYENPA